MTPDQIKYPSPFAKAKIDVRSYSTIYASWDFTQQRLTKVNATLSAKLTKADENRRFTIAVAGSFGRMEASEDSDLDFIVLTGEPVSPETSRFVVEAIEATAHELQISSPNPQGVFAQVTPYDDLIHRTGGKDDSLDSLAQRLLLMMEARPLFNETLFRTALDSVHRKYLAYVNDDERKEPLFLLNDLIRYFRSICVNYEFNFWREGEKWGLRNFKLRHSRVIMFAGTLLTLLHSSIQGSRKVAWIREQMDLTPLERIVSVYRLCDDPNYDRILSIYDLFLRRLQDKSFRESLQVDYEHRHASPAYREMKVTSDALSAELTRFIFAQRGRWSERAFEYLLF